jgi:hypothetical protein
MALSAFRFELLGVKQPSFRLFFSDFPGTFGSRWFITPLAGAKEGP